MKDRHGASAVQHIRAEQAQAMQQLHAAWLGLSRTEQRAIVSLLRLRSATLCSTFCLHAE